MNISIFHHFPKLDRRGIMQTKRGRGKSKNMNRGLMGMENGPGLTVEVGVTR